MDLRFLFHALPRAAMPAPDAARRVSGPIKGYFVLAYTVAAGRHFAGRSRVYRQRPVAADDAREVLHELATFRTYETQEAALRAAEHQARFYIEGLASNWAPFPPPV